MRIQPRAVLYAALAVVIIGRSAKAQERFKLDGREVAIYNLVGSARIVAGTGSTTEVEVTRVGRDAQKLRIETGNIDGANTLRVIYPGDDIVYRSRDGGNSNSTMRVNDDGTFGRGRGGRRVRVSTSNRGGNDPLEAGADIVVRVPAGVHLAAHFAVSEVEVTGVSAAVDVDNASGSITTRGTRGELKLNSASGAVNIADSEGNLDVSAASGSVQIGNARAASVKVDVASGSITADDVHAPSVDLETASGRIRARGIESGRVKLNTASGSVEAELNGAIESADIESASGSIHVRVPKSLDAEVEIETASGSIDVDFPLKNAQHRRGYLRGTIGAGKARVAINTASGSVTLRSQ